MLRTCHTAYRMKGRSFVSRCIGSYRVEGYGFLQVVCERSLSESWIAGMNDAKKGRIGLHAKECVAPDRTTRQTDSGLRFIVFFRTPSPLSIVRYI